MVLVTFNDKKNVMKKSGLFCLGILLSLSIQAQVIGKMFPEMEAETVEDKKVRLPQEARGKYTLLGLAYSKKSEEELNSWFQPVFEKFIQKTNGLLSGFGYDVNVYFVPMFTGINAAATGTAKRKALKNIDPQLLPYVLFYKGELKPYKESLDFEKKDIPYFFVLDAEGKIIYATSGKYTDAKMDKVENVME
jgi:ATP10 protein